MSQTVKIDEAAQSAISEIVGMPWEKDYYYNSDNDDGACLALVTREGTLVKVLVSEGGYIADLCHFEAEQIAKAMLKASEDAKIFMKAQTEWSRTQFKKLNCEIKGSQMIWGYKFVVNGKGYEVHFMTDEKSRTCIVIDGSGMPIYQKVTEDVGKVSHDDAAQVLKTFLMSKTMENEE